MKRSISPGAAAKHCINPYKIEVNTYGNRASNELNNSIIEKGVFLKILIHICKKPKFNPVMNNADANMKNRFCNDGKGADKIPAMLSDVMLSVNSGDISAKT